MTRLTSPELFPSAALAWTHPCPLSTLSHSWRLLPTKHSPLVSQMRRLKSKDRTGQSKVERGPAQPPGRTLHAVGSETSRTVKYVHLQILLLRQEPLTVTRLIFFFLNTVLHRTHPSGL